MYNSTDWAELVWAWDGWRANTGALMPDMYEQYVALVNQAAQMNGMYTVKPLPIEYTMNTHLRSFRC